MFQYSVLYGEFKNEKKTANIFYLHSLGFEPRIFDKLSQISCMYFGLINNKMNHSGTEQPALSPIRYKLLYLTF